MSESSPLACQFPGRPGPVGHIPACQLCKASPTYWRNQPPTPAPAVEAPTTALPTPTGGLNWSRHAVGDPKPCRVCGRPALMRDETGQPCHKACAEAVMAA